MSTTPDTEAGPWERQEGESDAAWRAFVAFRDTGPGRQILATYRLVYGRPAARITPGWFHAWSKRHAWAARSASWDNEQDRQRRHAAIEAEKAAIVEMKKRHVQAAMGMQGKAVEALRLLPAELLATNPRALVKLITEGVKIERLSRGEPDTIAEERHSGSVETTPAPGAIDPRTLTDAELEQLRAIQRAALERAAATDA